MIKPWNDESGDWQNLAEWQAPLYREVARVIDQFSPKGSVLDVGCGEALLRSYLGDGVRYLGIEPSAKAAASARGKLGSESIIHAMGETFDPGGDMWDCIVFNEVLYYTSNPLELLNKYSRLVRPTGIIIISIYQRAENLGMKAKLLRLLAGRDPKTNLRCTKIVQDFMERAGWKFEYDRTVTISGQYEHWRLWVVRPNLGIHCS